MPWRDWLGVGERRWKKAPDEEVQPAKTLWDWLQLLIVPAILIGVTFVWSATQTRSDNRREDRRIGADRAAAEEARRDATLQAYLDQMSGLMLNKNLLTSTEGDPVRAVARTVTLTTLRRLDGKRKAAVVNFLFEAHLLVRDKALVELADADLVGAELRDADLGEATLNGANLAGVNLVGAVLGGTNLADADLANADLMDAYIRDADLGGSNLGGADLRDADLMDAYLGNAKLGGANLGGADLRNADLVFADLKNADLKNADLRHADLEGSNLEGANNLDLGRFITGLPPERQKLFLNSQKAFLDSLSPEELAKFKLSSGKLARFRREASGP
jgi:uncharacterized protein YjbI with pentapeptide repeats